MTTTPRRQNPSRSRPRPRRLGAAELRRLGVEADADPRTVQRELDEAESVVGMVGDRIRAVLRRHGLVGVERPITHHDHPVGSAR